MHAPPAHGGTLRRLLLPTTERESLIRDTARLPAHTLTPAQLCTVEALLCGAYSPLDGFMGAADVASVVADGRLADGTPWPLPITLGLEPAVEAALGDDRRLLLRDEEGTPLALLHVREVFEVDRAAEARALFGTDDPGHAAAGSLLAEPTRCIAGRLDGIQLPIRYDFTALRALPETVRAEAARPLLGFAAVCPPHAGLEGALREAADGRQMALLLAVPAGSDTLDPVPYAVRARLIPALGRRLAAPGGRTCLLPMERRAASVRDLALRVLVLRNAGCAAVAVEPAAESPEALAYAAETAAAADVPLVHLPPRVYDAASGAWHNAEDALGGSGLNGRMLLTRLLAGEGFEDWMVHPEDAAEMRKAFPPRLEQGLVLFFTGLSGAGKSTVAKALSAALGAYQRPVTLLDGDVVRLNLSKGLGFSKEDRDTNILRIGYVASLVAKSGGLAVCAPIAPYRKTRAAVRRQMHGLGRFVEVHVATDLATCEARDPKGLYARARAGEIKGFTGIDDPYEAPEHPELRLDTGKLSVSQSIDTVITWLTQEGYLPPR